MPARSSRNVKDTRSPLLGTKRPIKRQTMRAKTNAAPAGPIIETATFDHLRQNPGSAPTLGQAHDFAALHILPLVGPTVWKALKYPINSVYKGINKFHSLEHAREKVHGLKYWMHEHHTVFQHNKELEYDLLTEQKNVCYWQREYDILANRMQEMSAIANLG